MDRYMVGYPHRESAGRLTMFCVPQSSVLTGYWILVGILSALLCFSMFRYFMLAGLDLLILFCQTMLTKVRLRYLTIWFMAVLRLRRLEPRHLKGHSYPPHRAAGRERRPSQHKGVPKS